MRRSIRLATAAAGLMLTVSGCQTWFGGMTLPSGHYLKHPPQYFSQDPTFPLQRELDSMADPDAASRRTGAGVGIPVQPAAPAVAPAPR